MADEITVVQRTGLGSRLMSSLFGVLVGIVLFFGSFVLLYWNEGRADLSLVARKAIAVPAEGPVPEDASGRLVSISGTFETQDRVGDGLYLKPAVYFAVRRQVEMYAWTQEEESHTTKNLGGSETTTTTYRYKKKWTPNPQSSDGFREPDGHSNPSLPFPSEEFRAASGSVGRFSFDPQSAGLPGFSKLVLSGANVATGGGAVLAGGVYVFRGGGDPNNPVVGDVRVSYEVLKPGFTGTLFGRLQGSTVTAFRTDKGDTLFRVFNEDRDGAIAVLHQEHVLMTWLFRGLGFLAMWIGLGLVLAPINTLLDIVPAFGTATRTLTGLATFLIALPLAIVTVLVSMLLHNLVALVAALVLTVGVVGAVLLARKNRVLARSAAAA